MPVFLPPPTSTEMHADVRHPISCIDSSSFITVSIPFVRPEQCTCRFTYMVKDRFSNVDRFYVILSGEILLVIIINRVNHYATTHPPIPPPTLRKADIWNVSVICLLNQSSSVKSQFHNLLIYFHTKTGHTQYSLVAFT